MATLNEDARRYLFDRAAPADADIAALEAILARKRYPVGGARSGQRAVALAASVLLGISFALWTPRDAAMEAIDRDPNALVDSSPLVPRHPPPRIGEIGDAERSEPFVILMGGDANAASIDIGSTANSLAADLNGELSPEAQLPEPVSSPAATN